MSSTARTETKLKKERPKKRGEEVGKQSPSHSEIEEPIVFKVIDGEDIQALAIKEDDLKKLAAEKKPTIATDNSYLVKKHNKNAVPTIEVKVAKLVPNKPLKPIDTSDNLGISFDKYGNCVPHSILGTVDDFLKEAVNHGQSIELPYDTLDSDRPMANLYLKTQDKKVFFGDNGENALRNWENKMEERQSIQKKISKTINRPVDNLVMNQAENARRQLEIKTLIDRTLPYIEHGKGYRLGSEFWNQNHLIGNEETGLHMTLKESDKGNQPPFEQISKPSAIVLETNFKPNQPAVVHYPWDKSKYLEERLSKLQPLTDEIVEHRPDFADLQVIGANKQNELNRLERERNFKHLDYDKNNTWMNPDIFEGDYTNEKIQMNERNNPYADINIDMGSDDPLSAHPDVNDTPIFGPCIIFGGQTVQWTGGDSENYGIIGLESRLNFETKAGKRVLATFEIINIGTTTVYYDWRRLPETNPFEITSSKVQRFYFDTRSGVILPGDRLKLHVVFKSIKGGIFAEKWEFVTRPQLLSGASLILTLRGVAVQEDKYKRTRASIEKKLFVFEAEMIAKNMLELILSGIRTPERPSTPQNAYLTEEDIFRERNPTFYYDHDSVIELKKLNSELLEDAEAQWDLSIDALKENIMNLDESDVKKQEFLSKLNAILCNMSFPQYAPRDARLYSIFYNMLCQTIDNIVGEFISIKLNLNLPITTGEETYPNTDEFNRKYEEWKKENEIFKQIEAEKKNRLAKEKGKEKGKKGSDKKDDKKKESDKKKVTNPSPTGGKGKNSREQLSRSVSRNQETRNEDRNDKTPVNTTITLTEEQLQNRQIFMEKAYLNAYLILSKMFENVETVFTEIVDNVDITQRLAQTVAQPKFIVTTHCDYID